MKAKLSRERKRAKEAEIARAERRAAERKRSSRATFPKAKRTLIGKANTNFHSRMIAFVKEDKLNRCSSRKKKKKNNPTETAPPASTHKEDGPSNVPFFEEAYGNPQLPGTNWMDLKRTRSIRRTLEVQGAHQQSAKNDDRKGQEVIDVHGSLTQAIHDARTAIK
jgi:hypothetical protein